MGLDYGWEHKMGQKMRASCKMNWFKSTPLRCSSPPHLQSQQSLGPQSTWSKMVTIKLKQQFVQDWYLKPCFIVGVFLEGDHPRPVKKKFRFQIKILQFQKSSTQQQKQFQHRKRWPPVKRGFIGVASCNNLALIHRTRESRFKIFSSREKSKKTHPRN